MLFLILEYRMIITLPLPPAALSPNSKSRNWRPRYFAGKKYKQTAHALALHQAGIDRPGWTQATVQYRFYFKTNRRRDNDNAISSMKWGLDSLVDTGILDDDSGVTMLPPIMRVDKGNPRVEVEILEVK